MSSDTTPPDASSRGRPVRREEAERLFDRAREMEPGARRAFLADACRHDQRLRDELASLLEEAEGAEAFFARLTDTVLLSSAAAVDDALRGPSSTGASAASRLADGDVVGHYRILEAIGTGGMGTVYRARDLHLDRDVALKFLPADLADGSAAENRLLGEARAAAAIEHPNVCTVHEIGETDDGRPFIVMALCRGETLKARIGRGPLPVEEAVEIAAQITRGLAAAHRRGIVHRDVKPGNVMFAADGTAKLLDFGLARVADVTLTRSGAAPGTVAYMSPEQARGDALDRRTDLWSLGVVLHEMLSGARPFRGGNDGALLGAILQREPERLRAVRPEAPVRLAGIVERLLRKRPEERYGSAEELLADLEGTLASRAAPRPARGAAIRRPAVMVGAAVALAALLGGGLWLAGRGIDAGPARTAATATIPSIAVLPLANLSPDPADAALADGMTQELIAQLARNEDLRVIASTSAFAFRDSPIDVRRIADSLGVAHVLEGGVQKSGSRLRVQARLVDASDGSTRWSETYDREFRNVFEVQDDIARAVALALDLRLGRSDAPPARRRTGDVAAYELYLRGSDPSLLRSDDGVRRAVAYFHAAIAADSTYAPAWAGLSRLLLAHANRGGDASARELTVLAEKAASRAVVLDDSLGEARAALGLLRWDAYDFASAEAEMRRAIALDPGNGLYRQWLAQLYIATERPAEALTIARRALELDPLSPSAHAEVAHALLANGRPDEALVHLQRIAGVQPPLLRARPYAAQAYAMKGMWPEAIEALRSWPENGSSETLALYGTVLARGGERDEARRVLATLRGRWQRGESGAAPVALAYAGLGDFDRAFAWLDRSLADSLRSDPAPIHYVMEPIYSDLRADPRFERIRRRLGTQNR